MNMLEAAMMLDFVWRYLGPKNHTQFDDTGITGLYKESSQNTEQTAGVAN